MSELPGSEHLGDWPLVAMHKVFASPMAEGTRGLEDLMDRLWHDGWEPFHVHECIRDGTAVFLVFNRRRASTIGPNYQFARDVIWVRREEAP